MATDKKLEKTQEKEEKKIDLKPGLTVKVHQKITETNAKGEKKTRIQIFEGMIIAVRKPKSPEGTFTIRKISSNVGVEKIIPFKSANLVKIEVQKKAKVRRAKLNYVRSYKKRLKEKKVS